MRKIEIEADLRVRFAGRGAEFDDGVEVGIFVAQMAAGVVRISRTVREDVVPALEVLARNMSYRAWVTRRGEDGTVVLEAERTDRRPRLQVVSG